MWTAFADACEFERAWEDDSACGRYRPPPNLYSEQSPMGKEAGQGLFSDRDIAPGEITGAYARAYCCLPSELGAIEQSPIARSGFATYGYVATIRPSAAPSAPPSKPRKKRRKWDACGRANKGRPSGAGNKDGGGKGGGGGGGEEGKESKQCREGGGRGEGDGENKGRRGAARDHGLRSATSRPAAPKAKDRTPDERRMHLSTWGFEDALMGRVNSASKSDDDAGNNVAFVELWLYGQIPVVATIATKRIRARTELLANYGSIYWKYIAEVQAQRHLVDSFYARCSRALEGTSTHMPVQL